MKLIILEDCAADCDLLLDFVKQYARQTGYDLVALPCASPEEMRSYAFDAALLDIMIGGRPEGVDTARSLRDGGFRGPIVFLTTSRDYYAEGFELNAVHYLVKPYTYEAFSEAMERLIRHAGRPRRTVKLPVNRCRVSVAEDDILYIDVYGRETLIHTVQEDLRVLLPLREVEAMLKDESFLRCFRSCIVNMKWITRAEEGAFILVNGVRAPIALRHKKKIMEKYFDYRFEKMRRNKHE